MLLVLQPGVLPKVLGQQQCPIHHTSWRQPAKPAAQLGEAGQQAWGPGAAVATGLEATQSRAGPRRAQAAAPGAPGGASPPLGASGHH